MADIVLNDNAWTTITNAHNILRCIQGSATSKASGDTFSVTLPAFTTYISSNVWPVSSGGTAYGGGSYRAQVRSTYADCDQGNYGYSSNQTWIKYTDATGSVNTLNKGDPRTQRVSWSPAKTITLQTGSYFTTSNKTALTATIPVAYITSSQSTGWYNTSFWFPKNGSVARPEMGYEVKAVSSNTVLAYATVTLDAKPVIDNSNNTASITYTKSYTGNSLYAGHVTATVTVGNLTARYGGDITNVTFRIGSVAESRSNAGTLSIPLDAVGSFTPTVTFTDSRGQSSVRELSPIEVYGYDNPSVAFDAPAERTTSTGVPDDEGTYAVISPTFTFTNAIASLQSPTVQVTNPNGTTTTVTPTWYSSRSDTGALSGSVTWQSLPTGSKVYGRISGFDDKNNSYQIAVTPRDTQGSGTTITQTLGSAFYTVDFLAGGHGIAFGKACTQTGFWCDMDAHFKDVEADGDLTVSGDINIASGAKYKINGTNLSASDVSAVPTTRTVNGKALSSNITLSANDVGAVSTSDISTIGTVMTESLDENKPVAHNTNTGIKNFYLDKGVWVVTAGLRWATNANGYRKLSITTSEGASDLQMSVVPISGNYTQMVFTRIIEVSADHTEYWLNGMQTSNSQINALAGGTNWGTYITAVRII